jgi:hypothetical protein
MSATPSTDQQPPRSTSSWLPIGVGAGVLVLLLATMGTYLATRDGKPGSPTITAGTTSSTTAAATTTSAASPEDQASAGAIAAYERFHVVVAQVLKSGGKDAALLESITSQDELAVQFQNANKYAARGWRQTGDTQLSKITVQEVKLGKRPETGGADAQIVLQSCEDAAAANAVDKTGKKIRAATAPTLYRWTVRMRHYAGEGLDGWLVTKTTGVAITKC